MTEPNRASRRAKKDPPAGPVIDIRQARELGAAKEAPAATPMQGSMQTFLVTDGVDVKSMKGPNGEEVRQLVIPVMGGMQLFLVPLTPAYAHDLARRLMRGDDIVTPL